MRQTRIYLEQGLQPQAKLTLPAQAAEHLTRVLRLKVGAALRLFNGDGCDYPAQILAIGKHEVIVQVAAPLPQATESPLRLHLAQGLARGEKMDFIIQKACELGAMQITPLLTERSEVKLEASRAKKRFAHWQAIAASACEQCARARLPQIDPPQPLERWLETLEPAAEGTQRLALHPKDGLRPQALDPASQAALLVVGPEGGLGEHDLDALGRSGFARFQLGPRILRTETAGLAALAVLQALYGDF